MPYRKVWLVYGVYDGEPFTVRVFTSKRSAAMCVTRLKQRTETADIGRVTYDKKQILIQV